MKHKQWLVVGAGIIFFGVLAPVLAQEEKVDIVIQAPNGTVIVDPKNGDRGGAIEGQSLKEDDRVIVGESSNSLVVFGADGCTEVETAQNQKSVPGASFSCKGGSCVVEVKENHILTITKPSACKGGALLVTPAGAALGAGLGGGAIAGASAAAAAVAIGIGIAIDKKKDDDDASPVAP